jgi:hypothetical protein
MKPDRYRTWAEEHLRQSPAITSVDAVQRTGEDAHITDTHVTFTTGAKVIVHWVGADQVGGPNRNPDGSIATTGPAPERVPVPELATSGRLRLLDIEAHLAAVLNNGGHPEVVKVVGRQQDSDPNHEHRDLECGLRVHCHSGADVFGIFEHTLPPGSRPGPDTKFKQREEV